MLDSLAPLIKHGTFPPLLLLFGDEEYLLQESLAKLTTALLPYTADTMNIDVLDGATDSLDRLLDIANSFPMMADKRAVILHRAEKLFAKNLAKASAKSTAKRKEQTPQEKSPFERYMAQPNPSTVLILIADLPEIAGIFEMLRNSKQSDKAKQKIEKLPPVFRHIVQNGAWFECASVRDRDIPAWIAKRVQSLHKRITPEAADLLALQTGNALRDIANEIEKTITFIGEKEVVELDDVLALVGSTKQYSVFELQKMIAQRKRYEAFTILQRLVQIERQELVILTLLTKYFLVLWKITEARRTTNNPSAIATAVGANVYFIDEYLTAATLYTQHEIERALQAIHAADIALKSTGDSPYLIMQSLLLTIMGGEPTAHSS